MNNRIMSYGKELVVAIVLLSIAAAGLWFYGSIDRTVYPYSLWDLDAYFKMAVAEDITQAQVNQPYCYRWMGPWLVSIMPFKTDTAFRLLTWFLGLTFILLYYFFLRALNYSLAVCLTIISLIVMNKYLFGILIWNFYQLGDLLSLIIITGLLWSLHRTNWIVFGVLLLLGVFARETTLLFIPVAFYKTVVEKRSGKYLLLLSIPAIITFVFIRMHSACAGGISLVEALQTHWHKIYHWDKLFKMFINVWLPISFLPVLFFEQTFTFIKDQKHLVVFVVLVYAASILGSDTERLVAPAGLVFYWLAAEVLSQIKNRHIFSLLLLAAAMLTCWHYQIGRFPLSQAKWSVLLSIMGLLSGTLILFIWRTKYVIKNKVMNELENA